MTKETLETLIDRVLGDTPIERVEEDVAKNAPELVQYLTDSSDAVTGQWQALPAERLARVYEAIARGMGVREGLEPPVQEDALFIAHQNDRSAVGRAFAEAFEPALPNGLFPLLNACRARVRLAPRQVSEQLRREPDVVMGGQAAQTLTEFGLTPSHLVVAADAVSMLIERAIDAEYFRPEQKLLFVRVRSGNGDLPWVQMLQDEASGSALACTPLATEISEVASVEKAVGEVLLDWLVDCAPYVRSLFSGFAAETARENVLVRPVKAEAEANLYWRWSDPMPRYAVAAAYSRG